MRAAKEPFWNPFHREFYMEPKRVLHGTQKGYPMGAAKEPFWNPFLEECVSQLTLLLSYSFRDSENNLALEMDIPQKGRYICST
jgi:hypothetical protein